MEPFQIEKGHLGQIGLVGERELVIEEIGESVNSRGDGREERLINRITKKQINK